jgi:hypothetical protein
MASVELQDFVHRFDSDRRLHVSNKFKSLVQDYLDLPFTVGSLLSHSFASCPYCNLEIRRRVIVCDFQSFASYFPRPTLLIRHPAAPRLKVT